MNAGSLRRVPLLETRGTSTDGLTRPHDAPINQLHKLCQDARPSWLSLSFITSRPREYENSEEHATRPKSLWNTATAETRGRWTLFGARTRNVLWAYIMWRVEVLEVCVFWVCHACGSLQEWVVVDMHFYLNLKSNWNFPWSRSKSFGSILAQAIFGT